MATTYTDISLMPFGKHKGIRLIDVPANYLLFLWDSASFDKGSALGIYIKDNLDVIKSQSKNKR